MHMKEHSSSSIRYMMKCTYIIILLKTHTFVHSCTPLTKTHANTHKMPRIWLDYCQFLMDQCKISRTRRTFDRALRALPLTQHNRIWPLYIKFIRSHELPETAVRVYRRYLKVKKKFQPNVMIE